MKRITLINLFSDFLLFVISLYLALWLRFNGLIPENYLIIFFQTVFLISLFKCAVYFFMGIYRIMIHFVQTHDVVRLIQANLISSLFFGLAVFSLKSQVFPYPRSAVIIDFMLSTIFTTGLRYIEKYILHSGSRAINKAHPVIKALIIGAG
ncbi:MAG: hypothetical protein PHF84_11295, partial [bacterium]|nr:hypothetical protein [bacterium]